MPLYDVGVKWETRRLRIEAKNVIAAKRIFCKMDGRKFNDHWSGASILTAKLIKKEGC